ncbi:cell death-inducing p53-target protein 1-like [Thalassophryne amazonica]|uniref:cell death-inducing p53-target protein 1-like n=1 Tax=Thalassophryne amazonica TaxID=390379 RepID=UPI001472548E|nr:cell death-inducing p53-target protein 1-like [Thalassophryne amazonica]
MYLENICVIFESIPNGNWIQRNDRYSNTELKKICCWVFFLLLLLEENVRIYHIQLPSSPSPPPPSLPDSFFPSATCSSKDQLPLSESISSPSPPRLKFVTYESELCHSAALTSCPFCQTRVMTQVVYRVGTHAWLMCLIFVLCGLVLGCCLIPFFVNHFKDAYHTCPRCRQVLHVHKKTCWQ